MESQFSSVSIEFTKKNSKKYLKDSGIFFTPKSHRKELLKHVQPFLRDGLRILEPSVGSGEFVKDLLCYYKNLSLYIDAIELNEELFNHVNTLEGCNAIHADFLKHTFQKRYDIILGNLIFLICNILA